MKHKYILYTLFYILYPIPHSLYFILCILYSTLYTSILAKQFNSIENSI